MTRSAIVLLGSVLLALLTARSPVAAETTLEKVGRTGVLAIGTRIGAPPFAFLDRSNQWVGFSIDLVEQGVVPSLEKTLGRTIKLEKKESRPETRIPLLSSNQVDLIAGTMTDAPEWRRSVDFSLTYLLGGSQFLVKKGDSIAGIDGAGGKRIAVLRGSTEAAVLRERAPTAKLQEFPDPVAALQALGQGLVDAYASDGIQLHGVKARAPRPDDWAVVGEPFSREPYAMAMRKGDTSFREVVDGGLRTLFESGRYFELYEKWFGPGSESPFPMTPEARKFLLGQIGK